MFDITFVCAGGEGQAQRLTGRGAGQPVPETRQDAPQAKG